MAGRLQRPWVAVSVEQTSPWIARTKTLLQLEVARAHALYYSGTGFD
jgi:hypothetical protein